MNINLYSCAHFTISFLGEIVMPSLTQPQIQKRIFIVASAAFSCLAICYLLRQYCFKPKILDDIETENEHQIPTKQEIEDSFFPFVPEDAGSFD